MNKFLKKTIIPLAILTCADACIGDFQKDEGFYERRHWCFGVDNRESSGRVACIENNPGSGFDGAATNYYAVAGSNIDGVCYDLFDSLAEKGPKDEKTGEVFAARANCEYMVNTSHLEEPHFKIENDRNVCCYDLRVIESNATYEAKVTMPRWEGCDHCWDKFLEGLTKHEQVHVDFCKAYSEKLEEVLKGVTASECASDCETALTVATTSFKKAKEERITAFQNELYQMNDDYDNETNHGETQGAVLDPNCDE